MTNEKLTPKVQQVLALAKKEAQILKNCSAGTEHLLLGLLDSPTKIIYTVLLKYGVNVKDLRNAVYECIGEGSDDIKNFEEVNFTPRATRIIKKAISHATKLSVKKVEVEHLFYSILSEESGMAVSIFTSLGLDIKQLLKEFKNITVFDGEDSAPGTDAVPTKPQKAVRKKIEAKFLNAYGVDVTQLAFDGKLEPVIGRQKEVEQIIEILSQKSKNSVFLLGEPGVGKTVIVEGLAQEIINGNVPKNLKDKYIISLDIAAMIAGTKYRGQFEERLKGVLNEIRIHKNIILFIDEAHQIIGAGATDKVCDLGNIVKPALARGELTCICATTPSEYKVTIEKDGALSRRFQIISINPPDINETIQILNGIKKHYETFHNVVYKEESIPCIVELTERFLPQLYFPDKAISILDAVGASKKIQIEKKNVKENIVEENDVRQLISSRTGIPNYKIENSKENIKDLEKTLKENIIGQDEAITTITNSLKRAFTDLRDPNRPIGSFIFLGPTGVGKTELCKKLAAHLFGDKKCFIQLDMSEFMEKHTVSTLTGAPPGYIGYEKGGKLTEAVKRQPYSVVLFDEIEKAHPDVWNILLQILEEGRLTDKEGLTVNFKNTVIIMTSNIGANVIQKPSNTIGFGKENTQSILDKVMKEVKNIFKPEFINRVDDIVIFNKLTKEHFKHIVQIFLNTYQERLLKKYDLKLDIEQQVINFLIEKGFSEEYFARELRRTIINLFETPLSDFLLLHQKSKNNIINAKLIDGVVTFK